MSYSFLTLGVNDRIATITVNRPDKLNALNEATIAELARAVDEACARDDVAGVILTGAGRAFVAGADIHELTSLSAISARALAQRGQALCRRLEASTKPTIAAVNGFALGGGCELAMACHIRVAAESAKFGQPEVKLGLVPGYGGSQRLARLVGRGRALQLLLTGETIDATEAYRIGLVNRVVAGGGEQLLAAATGILQQILMNAPLAIAGCIALVNHGLDAALEDALALEATEFGLLAASADMAEGTRAFLEKRAARFEGR
ncbi:MAG TPA: enoyl-CoA hydratase-related protein [Gemmatimonadaceae bacterium]|nr:enoyl-CoA hydratase-related protein [Gemmatimonadaceae bacterium]